MKLLDVIAEVPEYERTSCEVDVSAELLPPRESGAFVIVLTEPSIDQVYASGADVPAVARKHPLEHRDKVYQMLILSQCLKETRFRRAPEAESEVAVPAHKPEALAFIEGIAGRHGPMLMKLIASINAEWPWIQGLFREAEQRQGEMHPAALDALWLCVKLLKRLPGEVHRPGHELVDLAVVAMMDSEAEGERWKALGGKR